MTFPTDPNNKARLHEHRGNIAIEVGDGDTVYLTIAFASELARELAHAAYQVGKGYHYPPTEVTKD